jgi:pectate lyase
LIAFPCAEGYGKIATGARGGEVYEVTNLNSSGAGSLADGLSTSGRTIVFRVSGTIKGNFTMKENTTIAGQTAPGDGITISGTLRVASNVIIRYIRVRFDNSGESDAMGCRYNKKIMVDHVTGSWSTDEILSIYHNEDVTIQWSMVAEACPKSGEEHRFGGIWGNQRGTYHHNLIAHNASRNVRFASGCGDNDYRNNVIYNWGYQNCYGGEANQVGDKRNPKITYSKINLIGNYYKAGPATSEAKGSFALGSTRGGEGDSGSWFLSGNYMVGNAGISSDNWKGMTGSFIKLGAAWAAMPIKAEQTAEEAYVSVLADVGVTRPKRDSIETRIIEETKSGTASTSRKGLVACPGDTKLPELASTPAPADSDHDGMPDAWETANGLNPADATDRNKTWGPGYTMLEKYLNSIDSF